LKDSNFNCCICIPALQTFVKRATDRSYHVRHEAVGRIWRFAHQGDQQYVLKAIVAAVLVAAKHRQSAFAADTHLTGSDVPGTYLFEMGRCYKK